MASKGGKRPGAGRKKGQTTRIHEAIKARVLATGETPLEFLLRIMRAPEPTPRKNENPRLFVKRYELWAAQSLEAGKAAAPYMHPKLHSVEHKGEGGGPIQQRVLVEFV